MRYKRLVILLALSYLILASLLISLRRNPIPQCHEDVVLVGVGDFENGRWDSYICGPAVDDYHD